jgi:hypothetical protein
MNASYNGEESVNDSRKLNLLSLTNVISNSRFNFICGNVVGGDAGGIIYL